MTAQEIINRVYVQTDPVNNTWLDITGDVVARNVRTTKGIMSSDPLRRIAEVGQFTFLLRNDSITGLVHRYTPGHANCTAGFGVRAKIKLVSTWKGVTKTQWAGWIPPDGIEQIVDGPNARFASVVVYDHVYFWLNNPVTLVDILSDKNLGEVGAELLTLITAQPSRIDQTSYVETFANTNDTVIENTTIYNELDKAVKSELGYARVKYEVGSDDIVSFEGRQYFDTVRRFSAIPEATENSPGILSDPGHIVTANGNVQIDTAQSKFGGASALFDGTGDYLSIPDSDDWQLDGGSNSNAWTIDFWIRFNGTPVTHAGFIQHIIDENNFWILKKGGDAIDWIIRSGGTNIVQLTFAWTPSGNTWYHIALVKQGTTGYKMFVDGTQAGTTQTDTDVIPNFAGELHIGRYTNYYGQYFYFNGWLDEIRISKGIARWTSNFTPPAEPYSIDNYTKLLLHCDGEDGSILFNETGPYSITAEDGTVIVADTTVPFDYLTGVQDYKIVNGANYANRWIGKTYPRKVGTTAVIFRLNKPIRLDAGEKRENMRVRYVVEDGFKSISAQNAALTSSAMNSAEDGSGTNLTADLTITGTYGSGDALLTLENTGDTDGFVTTLEISGDPIYIGDTVSQVVEIASGDDTLYGKIERVLDQKYQSDPTRTFDQITLLATRYGAQRLNTVEYIEFCANVNETLAAVYAMTDQTARLPVYVPEYNIREDYYVNGIENWYDGDFTFCRLYVKPARVETYVFWKIGVPGNSELGSSARLGIPL